MRIRSILVPTDFGPAAKAAWQYASALAGNFKSRVHVLHVVADPFRYDAWGTEGVALRMADVLRESEKAAHKELSKLRPEVGARVTVATSIGTPVQQILEYASRTHVDLIVMGTHGRGAVGHLLLGSVAERVVRASPVPVVTLHASRKRRPRRSKSASRRVKPARPTQYVLAAPPMI